MKTSRYFQVILAFALTLTIIFINAGLAQYNTERLVQTKDQVPRTWQVKHRIQTILSSLVDAETGQRGYLMTGIKSFLEPYSKALKQLKPEISDLERLTLNDATQHANLLEIREGVSEFIQILKQHIEDRNADGKISFDNESLQQSKGKMDSLRSKLAKMGDIEESRLTSRDELAKLSAERTRATFFIAASLAISSVCVALFLFHRLVSERLKAEAEMQSVLAALEEKVAERTLVLARVNSSLEEANSELEAFSYSVSHDLRAPLRHISGFVELLQKKESDRLSENGKRYLNVIAESVKYGGVLVDDLLAFSKMSRTKLRYQAVDMNWMAEEAREKQAIEIGTRDIEWTICPLPPNTGDPTMIYLVWENLIHNALKYSRNNDKTEIVIGAERDDSEIRYFVRDNGVGFDMQYLGNLFGVFQRLHTKEEFEGTGIGLANVKRIVQRHGGRVWAESELGKGSIFWFSLPNLSPVKTETAHSEIRTIKTTVTKAKKTVAKGKERYESDIAS